MNYAMLAMRSRPYAESAVPPVPVITITQQPASTAISGGEASFSVSVFVDYGGPINYQWQSSADNGSTWVDITGETGTTLPLSGLGEGDSGNQYRVIISATNAISVTSSAATLVDGWSLAQAAYVRSFSVLSRSSQSTGVAFNADGSRMYVVEPNNLTVGMYGLSVNWDISTASFQGAAPTSQQDVGNTDIAFPEDGTKMFLIGQSTKTVREFSLQTAWDVTTASFVGALSISAQEPNLPYGLDFADGGTKLYITGQSGNVIQYGLATPWSVATASFVQSASVSAQTGATGSSSVRVSSSGTKMFVTAPASVVEYSLSPAFSVASPTFLRSFSVAAKDGAVTGIAFSGDGIRMYVLGINSDSVHQYSLTS